MTNHWLDLQNSKVFLIAGSNAAENHVMSMKWIRKAQEQGAKIIHVDPRFNRTSSAADIFARIRPGADIAYLGAIISYLIEQKLYDEDYVLQNTNALFLTKDEYAFEDGLFSGYDAEKHKYDNATWGYDLDPVTHLPRKAASLDDPRCVLQRLRQHYARYTFEKAEEISGIPAAQVKLIADTLVQNRPGTIMYALAVPAPPASVEMPSRFPGSAVDLTVTHPLAVSW